MTLRLIDGFDYLVTADVTKRGWLATSGSTDPNVHASNGRRGTRALHISNRTYSTYKLLGANYATLVAGVAYRPETLSGTIAYRTVLGFLDGTTMQFSVRVIVASGVLEVYRGTTLIATGTTVIPVAAYTYIELKVTFHGSTGAYELRVGGVTELSGSGINTITSANAYANRLQLGNISGGSSGTEHYYFDDLYVCDTAGSVNNDFLGDSRVDMVLPTADGNYSDFTPSAGTDNFANVDEATVDTANYNYSGTAGHRDSFAFADLPALTNTAIHAVQPVAYGVLDIEGSRSVNMMARSGTTDADATAQMMSTTAAYLSGIIEQDPNVTAPWTQATVNAAEFGVRVAV